MIHKRGFFTFNEKQIDRWVQRRRNGEWYDRKVTQEIECGGGKSSLVPLWACKLHQMGIIDKVCWVVPRLTLAEQATEVFEKDHWNWEQLGVLPTEAAKYEIRHLKNGNEVNPSKGLFGYATSYNAIAADVDLHIHEFQCSRYLLVLDEPQFAKLEKTFGLRIEDLAKHSAFILILSGDFDINGNERVAIVDYMPSKDLESDRLFVHTDYRYSYLDALSDNAVLPIDFNYADGKVSYFNEDTDELYEYQSLREADDNQVIPSLRAILKTQYSDELANVCIADWWTFRHEGITREGRYYPPFPEAQLLIVSPGIKDATNLYNRLIDQDGEWQFYPDEVVLVHSLDEDPKGKLKAFKKNEPYNGASRPVRIAITVAMAYVGMDAPDISHICVLTFYRSAPWIHQMLARAWRLYQRGHSIAYGNQYCVAFVPPDKKLDEIILKIRDSIRIGWKELDGTGGPGGIRRDSTIVEYGELVKQWRRFALDPESVREEKRAQAGPGGIDLVNLENIRDALMMQGLPADVVAEMVAIAEFRLCNTPKSRSAEEQYELDRKELETYQQDTVNQLMTLFYWSYPKDKQQWQALKMYVSGKLKDAFNGKAVKELDATEVAEAVANSAPKLRMWCVENKTHVLAKVTQIANSLGRKKRAA